jgi:hypothetical protein
MNKKNTDNTETSGSNLIFETLESYLYNNNRDNLPPPPHDEFPKLFKVKLSKLTENDIDSKILGLKTSPELALYTNLLLANYYESKNK